MSKPGNLRAYDIAAKLGAALEGESAQNVGVAIGMVLGQFILFMDRNDEGISEGIDAIAGDAKDIARKLRNMCQ